ncbi:hypothetical protein [Roseateles amylovorans]|uniref:Uncharacterized protein n=1 Tax=Roseateles amylovorans TaxID=2978473 RepID=A0ABY6B389_9BURK|nr:hypothetical protein [Roseateles amylovorans]UXH79003.1 hypothetical protein N4261_03430 [Roseateles amylovorans]
MPTDRSRSGAGRRTLPAPTSPALTRAMAQAVALAAWLVPIGSQAQVTPSDVQDLVGVRAPGGESELASRGYVNVGGRKGDDRAWTFWWNDRRGVCLSVATREGRYESLVSTPAADCGQDSRRGANAGMTAGDTSGADTPDRLVLICYGDGQRPTAENKYGYEWDNKSRRYVPRDRTEWTTEHFDTSVTLEIDGDRGRIRPAKNMVPPLHDSADNGWYSLRNVAVTAEEIRAEFTFNGFNRPKLKVDRRNGHISLEGMSHFTGTCDRADAARRF